MKTIKTLLIIFCCILMSVFVACSTGADTPPESSVATTVSEYSLSQLEEDIIAEINFARTKPGEYVEKRLKTIDASKKSDSYKEALNEIIYDLSRLSAAPELQTANGLNKCAKEWVNISGPSGYVGHESNIAKRFKKYCTYDTTGENCAYGYSTAIEIVQELLIDDGVSTRGHRQNILKKSFTHVGVAVGSHKKYKIMCCMDFASNYKEK